MDQKKIIWSKNAQDDFLATLAFYADRNGSKRYSEKLAGEVQEAVEKLKKHSELGRSVRNESIRIVRKGEYQIYYELQEETILILVVWSTKRKPKELQKFLYKNDE